MIPTGNLKIYLYVCLSQMCFDTLSVQSALLEIILKKGEGVTKTKEYQKKHLKQKNVKKNGADKVAHHRKYQKNFRMILVCCNESF